MTKTVKALEDSHFLMKGITRTLKNDIKKGGTLPLIPILLGTLGASLLTGRVYSELVIKDRECLEQDKGFKKKSLTQFHPLTNYEIQEYFKDEKRFNGVFSRNNLPNIKKEHISLIYTTVKIQEHIGL